MKCKEDVLCGHVNCRRLSRTSSDVRVSGCQSVLNETSDKDVLLRLTERGADVR